MLRWTFFAMTVGALLALVLWSAFAAFRRSQRPTPTSTDDPIPSRPAVVRTTGMAAAEPERPRTSRHWTAQAQAAMQRGARTEAWIALATALLLAMQETGRLRLHPSCTAGDYIRMAPDAETRALLRIVLRGAESVHYGGRLPPDEMLERMLAQTQSLSEVQR